ncbi:MAG TPA: hypothetical protein PK634_12075, partial [Kiritimatiellia bacterium]|nr:hypothetical protein [Kiritimatiellia bacterium]
YNADLPLTITNSGSYVLAEDAGSVSSVSIQITVDADDVVLDLNHSMLTGSGFAADYCVVQSAGRNNLTIKNGRISGSLNIPGAFNRCEDLFIRDGRRNAINTGPGSLIARCTLAGNFITALGIGLICADAGSIIRDCMMSNNMGGDELAGIRAGDGSLIERCVISEQSGGRVYGVIAGTGAILDGVVIRDLLGSAATNNTAVVAGNGALLTGCTLAGNVDLGTGSVVADCLFTGMDTVHSYQASVGHGSVVVDNVFSGQVAGTDAVNINSGSLAVNNRLSQYRLQADNGSLIAQNWADVPVFLKYDCYVYDNFLGRGISETGGWNRIEGNYLDRTSLHGTNVCINSFGQRNLIVKNFFAEDEDHVISGGANDHIAASIIPPGNTFTTNRPWGNVVRLE